MNNKFLTIILPIIIFIGIFYIFNQKNTKNIQKTLKIGENILNIEIADTEAKRIQGLSGKEKLAENEGMLFIFEKEGNYGIWMKDMNFSIDIAWLDKNKKIVYIAEAVTPETYPKVFYAQKGGEYIPSLYVLETNANFFKKFEIKISDIAEF